MPWPGGSVPASSTPNPLQACQRGHSQHLEHLLFYGAEPGAQNASGNTALHICALYNKVCPAAPAPGPPPDSSLPASPCPLFFHYFIHSFSRYFLNTFPVSGSGLGAKDTVVIKAGSPSIRDTPCRYDPECSEGGHRESRSLWAPTAGLGLGAGVKVALWRACHQC